MSAQINTNKGIISTEFFKKTAKYIGATAGEYIKEAMPKSVKILEDAKSALPEIKREINDSSTSVRSTINGMKNKSGSNLNRIMNWYMGKKNEFGMNEADAANLSFDGISDSSYPEPLEAEISDVKRGTDNIAKAMYETSAKQAEIHIETTANIIDTLTKHASIMEAGFKGIQDRLDELIQITAKNTSTLIEATVASSYSEEDNTESVLNGEFSFDKYKRMVTKNFQNTQYGSYYSMFKNTYDMVTGMGMGASESVPLVAKGIIDLIKPEISERINKNLQSIDDAIQDVFVDSLTRLGEYKHKGGPLGFLSSIFAIDTDKKAGGFGRSSLELKSVPFDSVTKEAIVNVIPGYLKDILNAISGTDKVYDYQNRKFVSPDYLQKQFTESIQRSITGTLQEASDSIQKNLPPDKISNMLYDLMIEDLGRNTAGGVARQNIIDFQDRNKAASYINRITNGIDFSAKESKQVERFIDAMKSLTEGSNGQALLNQVHRTNLNRNSTASEFAENARQYDAYGLDKIQNDPYRDRSSILSSYGRGDTASAGEKSVATTRSGTSYTNAILYDIFTRLNRGINVFQTGSKNNRDRQYRKMTGLKAPIGHRASSDNDIDTAANINDNIGYEDDDWKPEGMSEEEFENRDAFDKLGDWTKHRGGNFAKAMFTGNPDDVKATFSQITKDVNDVGFKWVKDQANKINDSYGNLWGHVKHKMFGTGYSYEDKDKDGKDVIKTVAANEKGGLFGFVKDNLHNTFTDSKERSSAWFKDVAGYFTMKDDPSEKNEGEDVSNKRSKLLMASFSAYAGLGILGGPIGLLAGSLAGIGLQSTSIGKKLKTFLFGKKAKKEGEQGEKGIFGKAMDSIVNPVRYAVGKVFDRFTTQLRKNVLGPLSDLGFAIKSRITSSLGKAADSTFGRLFKWIGGKLMSGLQSAFGSFLNIPGKFIRGAAGVTSGLINAGGGIFGALTRTAANTIATDEMEAKLKERQAARKDIKGDSKYDSYENFQQSLAENSIKLTDYAEESVTIQEKQLEVLERISTSLGADEGSESSAKLKGEEQENDDNATANAAIGAAATISSSSGAVSDEELKASNDIVDEAKKKNSSADSISSRLKKLFGMNKEKREGEEKDNSKGLLMTLVGGAITALKWLVDKAPKMLKDFVKNLGSTIWKSVSSVATTLGKGLINTVRSAASSVITRVGTLFKKTGNALFKGIGGLISKFVGPLLRKFGIAGAIGTIAYNLFADDNKSEASDGDDYDIDPENGEGDIPNIEDESGGYRTGIGTAMAGAAAIYGTRKYINGTPIISEGTKRSMGSRFKNFGIASLGSMAVSDVVGDTVTSVTGSETAGLVAEIGAGIYTHGKIDKMLTPRTVKAASQVASKAAAAAPGSSGFVSKTMDKLKSAIGTFIEKLKGSKDIKKAFGSKITKAIEVVTALLNRMMSALNPAKLMKHAGKVSAIVSKAAAKTTATVATAGGAAVVFGVIGAGMGAYNTDEIFGVASADVTPAMRLIAGGISAIFSAVGPLAILEIFDVVLGIGVMSTICSTIYKALLSVEEERAFEDKQKKHGTVNTAFANESGEDGASINYSDSESSGSGGASISGGQSNQQLSPIQTEMVELHDTASKNITNPIRAELSNVGKAIEVWSKKESDWGKQNKTYAEYIAEAVGRTVNNATNALLPNQNKTFAGSQSSFGSIRSLWDRAKNKFFGSGGGVDELESIKNSLHGIDMNNISEHNRIDYKNDTINVIRAKRDAILKQQKSSNTVSSNNSPLSTSAVITSDFGPRKHPIHGMTTNHRGIDITPANGATTADAQATSSGTVIDSGFEKGGGGNYVTYKGDNGFTYKYMHLANPGLTPGKRVEKGSVIGRMGNTGASTGPHLHYQVEYNGVPVNPLTGKIPEYNKIDYKNDSKSVINAKMAAQRKQYRLGNWRAGGNEPDSPLATNFIEATGRYSSRSGKKIDGISVHIMAGDGNLESCVNVWKTREASAHYCIDRNGTIGQAVREAHKAWSNASSNNSRIISIELANQKGENYPVTDATLNACIDLCVDICRRNNIKGLRFAGDRNIGHDGFDPEKQNLVPHFYTSGMESYVCPGPYVLSKYPYICDEVNKKLQNGYQPTAANRSGGQSISSGGLTGSNTIIGKIMDIGRQALGMLTGSIIDLGISGNDPAGGGTPSSGSATLSGPIKGKLKDTHPGANMANLIAAKTGLPASFVWAQMAHEVGGFGNTENTLMTESHNYAGIKVGNSSHKRSHIPVPSNESGHYRHFDSDDEFAEYQASNLAAYIRDDGLDKATTPEDYARRLWNGGYYGNKNDASRDHEADIRNYAGGMSRFIKELQDNGIILGSGGGLDELGIVGYSDMNRIGGPVDGGFDGRFSDKYESQPGYTNLTNMQPQVRDLYNKIAEEYYNTTKKKITITGGAETMCHSSAPFGHHYGWKLDLASQTDSDTLIPILNKYGVGAGDEGDHLDLAFHRKGFIGGTQVTNTNNGPFDGEGASIQNLGPDATTSTGAANGAATPQSPSGPAGFIAGISEIGQKALYMISGGLLGSNGSTYSPSGAPGASGAPATVTGETQKDIWNYLTGPAGYSKENAAAIMGNFYGESGYKSNNLENSYESSLKMNDEAYTAAVDDGSYGNFVNDSAGYGLAQWTYHTRKKAMQDYIKGQGKSIGDLGAQLEFFDHEVKTGSGHRRKYSETIAEMDTLSSIDERTQLWCNDYENTANKSIPGRKSEANRIFKELGGSGGGLDEIAEIQSSISHVPVDEIPEYNRINSDDTLSVMKSKQEWILKKFGKKPTVSEKKMVVPTVNNQDTQIQIQAPHIEPTLPDKVNGPLSENDTIGLLNSILAELKTISSNTGDSAKTLAGAATSNNSGSSGMKLKSTNNSNYIKSSNTTGMNNIQKLVRGFM